MNEFNEQAAYEAEKADHEWAQDQQTISEQQAEIQRLRGALRESCFWIEGLLRASGIRDSSPESLERLLRLRKRVDGGEG